MSKLAVVAIGGNSLIQDEEHRSVPDQLRAVEETVTHIGGMIVSGWNVVITHGNGPQVGFLLQQAELARGIVPPMPLDSCVAETQGALGYLIQQALVNELRRRGLERHCVSVLTQVVVSSDDPALQHPSKPIGSFYTQEEARHKMEHDGWTMMEDAGRGWRRVVPSPEPREIMEQEAINTLVRAGFLVIASGGGGIPVIRNAQGELRGIEAVIDKDLASSLLAIGLNADLFMISTAVEKVALNYRQPGQRDLDTLTLEEARRYDAEGHFSSGSMGPKIRAVIRYLEHGGGAALITRPEAIGKALSGRTGTWILP